MFDAMNFKFYANNKPSTLKAKPSELDSVLTNYLSNRNDTTPLETFKEGKRFFKGVAATTSQINLFSDKIGGKFTKKGLQSLLSDFDFQGIAVRVDHVDNSLAVGKVFDAKVVTRDAQTRLEAFFWIDGNEPVISKMDSGTYSELSVSFGGFNKLSCGTCGVEVSLDKLRESAYYKSEDECLCDNGHVLNDPKQNFINMDNCKPLDEISVVYSGRVRDTAIVKLSKSNSTSLQNDDEELQSDNKFLISGDFTSMDPKTEVVQNSSSGESSIPADLLKIIQEHAVFKATLDIKTEQFEALKAENVSLKQKITEQEEQLKAIQQDLSSEKTKSQEFSKSKEDLDNLLGRVGLSAESNWSDKIVSRYVKAEEFQAKESEDTVKVLDSSSLSVLSKISFNRK